MHRELLAALIVCHRVSQSPEKSLKYKRVFWGVHYRNLKTALLWPEAALDQQLEFHWAAEDGENAGNWRWPGSVRGEHTKRRGLCGRLRNVPASTLLKTLWCATPSSLLPVRMAAGTCVKTLMHSVQLFLLFPHMFILIHWHFVTLINVPNCCFSAVFYFFSVKLQKEKCCTFYSTSSLWRL